VPSCPTIAGTRQTDCYKFVYYPNVSPDKLISGVNFMDLGSDAKVAALKWLKKAK
jgi:hypothetical protein